MLRLTTSLLGLLVAVVALSGCARAGNLTLGEKIDALFNEGHDKGEFDGDVLVMRDGASVYQASFGLADRHKKIANAADTKFLAFSVNKPVTAVLVFQLIQAEKITLDDRLDRF